MERYVCVHGHFYQPPRENPWLETIEQQDSAYPYHDWNERITAECFAPNAACRILDREDRIVKIVNNYARMSFNFGPTLLSWLEVFAPEVYEAILAADLASRENYSGHGAALAQAYNHIILPLATRRQKELQIVWGIRDFEKRFGRPPEGFWLPETAVDSETLELLSQHGIRFTILSPHQARRLRRLGEKDWEDVDGTRIETRRSYRLELPSGGTIALFFYDGPISRAVAFENLLHNGEDFAARLASAFSERKDEAQLVHLATDGETYGHHHRFGDMALAFALERLEREQLARLTNYGEFLEKHPPAWEVEIVENSSWSCVHGIERWRSDCGCRSGFRPDWHQRWRAPLRRSLDWLREYVDELFEEAAAPLLPATWEALQDYIQVILDRSEASLDAFWDRHAVHSLTREQRSRLLELLEMQRFAALMYTSCGWFFDEVSGLESSQILQYAGRVVQLASKFSGSALEESFKSRLAEIPSNLPEHGDGRRIYEKWVQPAQVDLLRVGAHFTLSSLFENYGESNRVFCYDVEVQDLKTFQADGARAAVGRAEIISRVTFESSRFSFASVHFGDHNVSGGVGPTLEESSFHELCSSMGELVGRIDLAGMVGLLDRHFPEHQYSLDSLFRDEQTKIVQIILDSVVSELEASMLSLYRQKTPLMRYLESLGLPLPRPLALTAQLVVDTELRKLMHQPDFSPDQLLRLVHEAEARRITLDSEGLGYDLQRHLERIAEQALSQPADLVSLDRVETMLDLISQLPVQVDLWRVQNLYWRVSQGSFARSGDAAWREGFRGLGAKLRVGPPDSRPELPSQPALASEVSRSDLANQ